MIDPFLFVRLHMQSRRGRNAAAGERSIRRLLNFANDALAAPARRVQRIGREQRRLSTSA